MEHPLHARHALTVACMSCLHHIVSHPLPGMQLAEELGYAVETRKPGTSEWQEHISEVAASTGLSGRQVCLLRPHLHIQMEMWR